jgi:uncharacterized membrane protein
MQFKETQTRTIAKVISWRVFITLSHFINALIVTGSIAVGLQIAGLATVINSVLFWTHERVWNYFQWNRKKDTLLKFNEGYPRSVSKIVSWRILITFSNFLIPFIITGSWGSAVMFAGMATAVNIIIYWSHERLWNWFKWGKVVLK